MNRKATNETNKRTQLPGMKGKGNKKKAKNKKEIVKNYLKKTKQTKQWLHLLKCKDLYQCRNEMLPLNNRPFKQANPRA